jgi:hypothetical protein
MSSYLGLINLSEVLDDVNDTLADVLLLQEGRGEHALQLQVGTNNRGSAHEQRSNFDPTRSGDRGRSHATHSRRSNCGLLDSRSGENAGGSDAGRRSGYNGCRASSGHARDGKCADHLGQSSWGLVSRLESERYAC